MARRHASEAVTRAGYLWIFGNDPVLGHKSLLWEQRALNIFLTFAALESDACMDIGV